jgi:hypothetical protein
VVLRVSAERSVPCFDLASQLPPDKPLWADGQHNSRAGAALKASLVADFLEHTGLVPPPSGAPR